MPKYERYILLVAILFDIIMSMLVIIFIINKIGLPTTGIDIIACIVLILILLAFFSFPAVFLYHYLCNKYENRINKKQIVNENMSKCKICNQVIYKNNNIECKEDCINCWNKGFHCRGAAIDLCISCYQTINKEVNMWGEG